MGGLFSSPAPPAATGEPTSGSESGSKGKSRKQRRRKARSADGSAAGAGDPDSGDDDAEEDSPDAEALLLAQYQLIPIKLELAWQETDRLSTMLHKWGGGATGVAKVRASMATDLGMAYKNIAKLVEARKRRGEPAKAVSLRDPPSSESALDSGAAEPNDFDRKRTKKLMKKLRTACKAAKPLKLPRVADPWGDEDPAWRAKFVEERGTAIMVLLDGLQLHGDGTLRAQRKAIIRILDAMGRSAIAWAATAPKAEEAKAPAPAPAKAAAPAPEGSEVAAESAAAEPEQEEEAASSSPSGTATTPASKSKPTADGWTTVSTGKKKRRRK
jgi:hypothetical protein